MAWHSTWEEDQIVTGGQDSVTELDLPSLKYLLADLCNAINERYAFIPGSPIAFTINSGTSTTPEPSDFVGMSINEISETYDEILAGIFDFYGTSSGDWYKPDYSDTWSRSEVLADAGYTTADIGKDNWRNKSFYLALRAMLERARYLIGIDNAPDLDDVISFGESDPQPSSGADNSVEDAWDSVSLDDTSSVLAFGLRRQIESGAAPNWYIANKSATEISFTFDSSDFGALTGGTVEYQFAKMTTNHSAGIYLSTSFSAEGLVDGEAYEFTYSASGSSGSMVTDWIPISVIGLTGSIAATLDIPADSPITDVVGFNSYGIQIVVGSVRADVDINALLEYNA
jgi:hypothetical protein